MPKKNHDNICILLNDGVLKITQVKGSGASAKVTNVVSADIAGLEGDALAKKIHSNLKGFNIKNSNHICVVSPNMATTKNIEIPSVSDDEIKSIVNLQAGRHTPFARDEIQPSYLNLGVYKSNYTKVLLVIANRNVLKMQLGAFEKAGLKIQQVLFPPESVASFYTKALKIDTEATPSGIIDIGKDSTDFIVTLHGLSITTRNIPVGKTHLGSEGETARDRLVEELSKTMESYKNEDIDEMPVNFILTSDDMYTKELAPILSEKFGWNTKVVSYLDHIKAAGPVIKKLGAEYGDSSFLDIISSALQASNNQVNLLPEEVLIQKTIEDKGKQVVKTGALGFATILILALSFGIKIYFNSSYLDRLKNDYKDNRTEVMELEKISNSTSIIQNYLRSRMMSLDTIQELYEKLPQEIYLTSVVLDDEGNVSLQGVAEKSEQIYKWSNPLKESDLFKSVEIKSTTAKKDRGKDAYAFEIALTIKSAGEGDGVSIVKTLEEE